MAADVIEFGGIAKLDMPPERILARAAEAGLESVVILGYTKEGDEYFRSSLAAVVDVLWLLERLKLQLLSAEA